MTADGFPTFHRPGDPETRTGTGRTTNPKRSTVQTRTPIRTTPLTVRSANEIDAHVGGRLRERRLQIGMSQQDLAERLGTTFQQVQKYERGISRIGASRLHRIATALGVSIGWFFEGEGPSAPRATAPAEMAPHVGAPIDGDTARLLEAFARIDDPALKQEATDVIEALASGRAKDALVA